MRLTFVLTLVAAVSSAAPVWAQDTLQTATGRWAVSDEPLDGAELAEACRTSGHKTVIDDAAAIFHLTLPDGTYETARITGEGNGTATLRFGDGLSSGGLVFLFIESKRRMRLFRFGDRTNVTIRKTGRGGELQTYTLPSDYFWRCPADTQD